MGWQPLQAVEQPRTQVRARLSISDRTGATRDYSSFTRRDVELAGEGLASGKYTVVALFAGPRYLYLKAGDQTDGRGTVTRLQRSWKRKQNNSLYFYLILLRSG